MSETPSQFEQRKQDHIDLALMPANQACEMNTLDHLTLPHEAIPDLNFSDINITGLRFNRIVPSPFLVSSMTAGHKNAQTINHNLMSACSQSGWAMGVGSQRREVSDKEAAFEWSALRKKYPDVELYSNLGIAQVITTPLSDIQRITESLNAQALIIHLNALQECIQPEGTPEFKGSWQAIEHLIKHCRLPVILKETGCGFAANTLKRLNHMGVAAVDVSGLGGTHWGRIEGHRAGGGSKKHKTSETYANWGIDTVTSVLNAIRLSPDFEVWGSGGIRNGLDAAKILSLGANTVGFAKPMLEAALSSDEKVYELMSNIEYELKVALFCTNSQSLKALKEKVKL